MAEGTPGRAGALLIRLVVPSQISENNLRQRRVNMSHEREALATGQMS